MGLRNFAITAVVIAVAAGPKFLDLATTVRPHPITFAPLRPLDPDAQSLVGVERLFEDDPSFKV
jgi:hypothetical protein